MRNHWLPALSPFPSVFSKAILPGGGGVSSKHENGILTYSRL